MTYFWCLLSVVLPFSRGRDHDAYALSLPFLPIARDARDHDSLAHPRLAPISNGEAVVNRKIPSHHFSLAFLTILLICSTASPKLVAWNPEVL